MSKLAEFRALEQQLAAQLAELEALKKDDGLKKEMEFEEKLRASVRRWRRGQHRVRLHPAGGKQPSSLGGCEVRVHGKEFQLSETCGARVHTVRPSVR